jgi:integrase
MFAETGVTSMGEIDPNSITAFLDQRRVAKDPDYRQLIHGRIATLRVKASSDLNALHEYWELERKKWRNLDDDSMRRRRDAEAWLEAIGFVVAHPDTSGGVAISLPDPSLGRGGTVVERYTLSAFRKDYIDYVKLHLARKTVENAERVMKAFVAFIGDKSLSELTLQDMEKYMQSRKGKVSDSTINIDVRTLKAAMGVAVTWGKLSVTPFRQAKSIRVAQKEKKFLTSKEVANLLGAIKEEWYKNLVEFALVTGLRRGEVLNLRRADYDIKSGVILVQSSESYQVKGGKFRRVALNDEAVAILSSLPGTSEWFFIDGQGEKIREDLATKKFKRYAKEAGLSNDLHFHSLRHTFATLARNNGMSRNIVQAILGHASEKTTEGYIGKDIETMKEQMKKVSLKGYISVAKERTKSE